jgi:NADH-quinone oxidoreductase subunit G
MPKITVDGKTIECKDKQVILQACLDAGTELPHYCYHPGLSIVASCRICLVEVEGIPKLVPSCQTVVRDGMVVHSKSSKAIAAQKQVMEYLLINHPLDCPVCDQAGECLLQDYSYQYGRASSRFEEDKVKNAKKDVGAHVLLYSDRCIMCTRCVRFTREVSGTSELFVEGRGHKEEIDIFPGKPLNNKLSLNVVDLCPVGALLEKEFLFKQRVWLLKETPSISPVDAGGENIFLHHNEGVIYRIKPRFNPDVNQWWCSDDTRLSYQPVHSDARLRLPMKRVQGALAPVDFNEALKGAIEGLRNATREGGPGNLFAVLSPMMGCEEAWLLGKWIRSIDPGALLVMGPVPTADSDEVFKNYITGQETFRIHAEKVPNRRGIERVMKMLDGPTMNWDDFAGGNKTEHRPLKAGWIVGGYLSTWAREIPVSVRNKFIVVQDTLPNALTERADALLPSAFWAEKGGCWENHQNRIQAFESAIAPPEGVRREGELYHKLLGRPGMYSAAKVRAEMAGAFADVKIDLSAHRSASSPMEFVEV